MVRDLLHIVRSALWNEPMPEVEISDVLVQLIMQQGVGPLVYPALQSKASLNTNSLNTKPLLQMKQMCVQNMQVQAKMGRVLEVAWRALTDAGIRPVLMKGAGLAAYYPEPSMRQWSDIDLFVGKAQYHPACAAMRAAFPNALKFDEELDHYKHYNLIADGVAIEIHRVSVALTHPRDILRYAKMERFGMAHAIPLKYINTDTHADGAINIDKEEIKNEIVVPEVTFNVLMVFLHSWEHMLSGGANIRQLCDLALLLKHTKSEIDAVRLKRWLKDLRALDIWQIYMGILVHELGMREEEVLFYNERVVPRAQKMIAWILNDPRPEQPKIQAKNRLVRKWRTMMKGLRRADEIASISPSYARHEKQAVLLKGMQRFLAKDRHWE